MAFGFLSFLTLLSILEVDESKRFVAFLHLIIRVMDVDHVVVEEESVELVSCNVFVQVADVDSSSLLLLHFLEVFRFGRLGTRCTVGNLF